MGTVGGREKFLNWKIVEVIVRVIIQCQAGISFEGSAPLGLCGPVGSPPLCCLRTTVTLDSRAQGSWLWGPFGRLVESRLLQLGLSLTLCLWFVKHGLEEWGDCLFPLFGETPEIPDDICYSAPGGGRQFFLLLLTPGCPRIGEGGEERAYFLVSVVYIYNVFLKYIFLYIFNILFFICLYIQCIS